MRGYVRSRGKGKYQLCVEAGVDPLTGKRRQVWRTITGSKRSADEALRALLLEVGQGEHVGADATVGQLLDAWMASAELSPSTRRDYQSAINVHIKPWGMAGEKVWRVRAHHVDKLYADLGKHLGVPRIRRVHTILHRAFRQAVKWGWVSRNPVSDASPPSLDRPDLRPPTVDEMRALLDAAVGEFRVWLFLDAGLGARRGELCALRWSDVDLDLGEATIRRGLVDGGPGVGLVVRETKTGRSRRVALDSAAVDALRAHRRECAARALACGVSLPPDGFVFSPDPDGARPWRPDRVTKLFAETRTRAGVQGVRVHDLRHFVATQLLGSGVDVRTVAGRLGHARPSVTLDIYGHFVPARDRDAAVTLGRLLSRDAGPSV